MQSLTTAKIHKLEKTANEIRVDIIKMLVEAGSGHSAGPLGMADIFTCMYFHILNHDPKKPNWSQRDRLILSNGHICPVQYATMAHAGYFPHKELSTLRKLNTRLQGHPHRGSLPGIETTSGPLGSGLSQAIGVALAGKLNNMDYYTYCLMSDGEHQEGNLWEAVMFAGKNRMDNLIGIIDRNNIQIDGNTEDIMPLNSLREKYESFNWHVLEINGHSVVDIIGAVNEAKAIMQKPTVIIAHTIAGKGVSYMEKDYKWHGMPPGKSNMEGEPAKEYQVEIALHDIRTLGGNIKSEHE
ncbi:MAG: transketolase [Candidatus Harrisonbacteria bacterium CG10_big_fil_rev_8_21_14_0_10_38_8]|uniref:Transketolase n=1 Tax=Candidatus Harrisonbacteria bacterium CG10_big_fil_rev_8_21_14_0_10_38_8 TaxID=1974582 RepID=A0A2M6WJP3_9BACT|nr:MAG: transketolase [Candidatus Harrisonbacteria bacterium CG10_big_fil_rev_8_21_14_0_10_38_8]